MNRALQCSSEEGKWHHCRSAGKDSEAFWRQHNKIQIMVPALLLVPKAISSQRCFGKGRHFAHGCWAHPQEQRGPGCTQGWTPLTWGCRYPCPHMPACAHTFTLPFYTKTCCTKCCDLSSMVPNVLLSRSSAWCVLRLSNSWLQTSLLCPRCALPNTCFWGLSHTPACILAH